MKKILFLLFIISSLLLGASNKKDKKWVFSGRLNGYFQAIDVDGPEGTGEKEGYTHNQDLTLRFLGPVKNGTAGVEIRGRLTNDNSIEKDAATILYFHSFFKNKKWYLEAGDVSASVNPYVFGGSVKGFKATYKSPKKTKTWDYMFIGGLKKATWKETVENVKNEQPDAYTGAFEAKYRHKRAQEVSFSVAAYKDDLATGDANSTILGKKGVSLGVQGKWRFNRYVTLRGRFGLTDATDDIKNNKPTSSHTALQLKLLTKPSLRKVRSNFVYTRISPKYISLAGSANKDMEQFENSNTWRISRELTSRFGVRFKRDNLDNDLNGTQRTSYEHISFNYRPKALKRSDINVRFSNMDIKGRGTDSNTKTAGLTFNLRQKSGWRYALGLDYSDANDNNASSNITKSVRLTVGYKKRISKDKSYRINATINQQRTSTAGNTDTNYGLKLDMGYNPNRRLSLDLYYLSRFAFKEASEDSEYSSYQARANYKLDNKGKKSIRFLIEKKHNDIENTPGSSYNEYKAKVSYVINF